jgi:hypothetical protein
MCRRSIGRRYLLPLFVALAPFPVLGQGVGAGAGVPGLEEALARLAPRADSVAETGLLRRGTGDLQAWRPLSLHQWLPARLGDQGESWMIVPELRLVRNSSLSYSPNEGSLWASRGLSSRVRFGAGLRSGSLELVVAPEIAWSRNLPFHVTPPQDLIPSSGDPRRHTFASPWHGPPRQDSADLPLRPGAEALLLLDPGQTTLAVHGDGFRFGVGTENRWWGPGLVNALVLSGHAPGFPHAFLETTRPHPTRFGNAEAVWFLGRLVASPWFAAEGSPRARTVSGVAFALEPTGGLRVGGARIVVRPDPGGLGAAFDPILSWEPFRDPPENDDGTESTGTDQLFSLFFQIAPTERVEVYGEWARMDPPDGVRELLETPQHSQGYTLGLQWRSRSTASGRSLRIHAEATNLEQTRVRPDRPPPPSFYTGRATSEGLTHRGRVLGATIGPGAQSQHLSVELLGPGAAATPEWWGGMVLGRIRWENDTFTRIPLMTPFSHDTSFLGGLRGAGTLAGLRVEGSVLYQRRLNYLFQNGMNRPAGLRTVDVTNWTVGLTLRPSGDWPW